MSLPTGAAPAANSPHMLMIGPPGSGKRTQAPPLASRLGVPALSTGDLLRAMMTYDTPLSARARDVVAYGGYVDDKTINEIVSRRLDLDDTSAGFVLYGYPRTSGQARHLDHLLEQQQAKLDTVLVLQSDDEAELEARLKARGRALHRIDDKDETISSRLALYHEQTEPVVEMYRQRHVVTFIHASGTAEQVTRRINEALNFDV